MKVPALKVIAGDDGQAWLCFPVTSPDMEAYTALFVELAGTFRALKMKVRTAELTRFRGSLKNVKAA